MIKENYVIKKEIKLGMFYKTLKELNNMLTENNNKFFQGKESHLKDGIDSINFIKNNKTIRYHDAFFIMFAFTNNFISIKQMVENNEIDFSYLVNEEFWENNEIDINAAIFFSYTFLNELYKEELELDFKKLENLEDLNDYIKIRNLILKKSLKN